MSKRIKFYEGQMIEYEIYKLVDFYDPILRKPTVPWDFSLPNAVPKANYVAFSLAETLGHYEGLGLSANQVGLNHRVCVINMGSQIWTLFNPTIIDRSDELSKYSEGCLSYPGLYIKLPRSSHIKIKFNATNGQVIEKEFDGLSAVCVQHELDHLDGIVFTEKVSPITLDRAKRKVKTNLKRMKRLTEEDVKRLLT